MLADQNPSKARPGGPGEPLAGMRVAATRCHPARPGQGLGPGRGRPAVTGSAPPRFEAAPAACQPGDPVRPDPKVRRDGKCACGCGKPLVRSRDVRRYAGAHLDVDPFASSRCCRKWHGTLGEETQLQKAQRDRAEAAERNEGQQRWGRRAIIGTLGQRRVA